MDIKDFVRIREIKSDAEMSLLKKGDVFLMGHNMCTQIQTKNVGQEVSYFQVMENVNNKIRYRTVFDKLTDSRQKG